MLTPRSRNVAPWIAALISAVFIVATILLATSLAATSAAAAESPNFVVIFADDLGYGDLGCFGNPTIETPNLDGLAREGMQFSQFYSAACVCTPSRAAIMTSRLPIRSGMCAHVPRVLFPDSTGGLPADEVTIAEALKGQGYATACVGKWHLGHLPQYLPTSNGFDSYFGIPYSNDMLARPARGDRGAYPPLPLMRDMKVLESSPDQRLLTRRYTEEAIKFIRQSTADGSAKPFFLYMPHTMPHVPLFASGKFEGTSLRGLYGDVVEEIDWSVGRILATLREQGVADNTLVWFTSDNGPWLIKNQNGGTAGLLRGGKGSTWEGGMREPTIAWWPGRVASGTINRQLGSTLDVMPTILALAGAKMPDDRVIDGYDLAPVLFDEGESPRQEMFYYRGTDLYAVRKGPWKAHFRTQDGYGQPEPEMHDPPLLYHLEHDPSERFDLAKDHPEVLSEIKALVQSHKANLVPGEMQLLGRSLR